MFPGSRTESEFLNEFFIMDVILNPASSSAVTGDDKKGKTDYGKSIEVEYDVVSPFVSCKPEHLGPEMDYLDRAAILFRPHCGVFYCHRERCRGDVGMPGTLTAYDLSWLRLQREESSPQTNREILYTFGVDSFVSRFFSELKGETHKRVPTWRISTGYRHCSLQNRVVYRVCQSHDVDGPLSAPDFIRGEDKRAVPWDHLAAAYQELLLVATSGKKDGRHYADGCCYYELSESCSVVDPIETHFADIVINIDMSNVVGRTRKCESIVMIRNVTKVDAHDDSLESLQQLTLGCAQLRVSEAKGNARAKSSDIGTMFAIGTRIPYKKKNGDLGVPSAAPYAANGYVPEALLRKLVVDLVILGSHCFPQVYSVINGRRSSSNEVGRAWRGKANN